MKYAKPKTVEALLRLIFRMQQGACRCCFCPSRLPISHKWMSTTNQNINYPRCKATDIDTLLTLIFRMGLWPCCWFSCLWKLPIYITVTNSQMNYCTYKTTNCLRSIDAHFDVLSTQHLLPLMIVLIMIWTDWLSFWQIETLTFGKAKHSNILALFALTWLKFMYLAIRFVAPAIHLFVKWYSQAMAHHSGKIYV
jgi:hypothetical protein